MHVRPKRRFTGVLLFSFLLSLLFLSVLLLLTAKVLLKAEEPLTLSETVSLLLPGAGALTGGFLCGRRYGKKGLLCGLSIGLLYVFAFLLLSFVLLPKGGEPTPISYGKIAALLFSAVFGGLLGSIRRVSGKKHRKR